MVTTSEAAVEAQVEELEEKTPWFQSCMKMAKKQPVGVAGLAVVIAMIFAGMFAPWLTPYHPEYNSFEYMLTAPNAEFWLGTDQFGRDILTRILFGAQTALFVGFSAITFGTIWRRIIRA